MWLKTPMGKKKKEVYKSDRFEQILTDSSDVVLKMEVEDFSKNNKTVFLCASNRIRFSKTGSRWSGAHCKWCYFYFNYLGRLHAVVFSLSTNGFCSCEAAFVSPHFIVSLNVGCALVVGKKKWNDNVDAFTIEVESLSVWGLRWLLLRVYA